MITPQSTNWASLARDVAGRRPVVQAHIEGLSDVICTEAPADAWSKTYAIGNGAGAAATDNITFGSSAALAQLPDWTILIWYRFKGAGSASGMLVGSKNSGSSRGYGISLNGANIAAEFATGTYQDIATNPAGTGWHFVAVSVGGVSQTVTRAIIDDTQYGPFYSATTYSSRNTWTAATAFHVLGNTGVGNWQNIEVGYLAVCSRALTHSEMRRLKYRRIDRKWGNDDSEGLYDACVAEWRMERGTGTTVANDRNIGTHDGTIGGAAAWASSSCYTVTYRPVLSFGLTTGQSIDALSTRTSIQTTSMRVADTDQWLTALLASGSLNVMRKSVRFFFGFDALLEEEYQPILGGIIADIDYASGVYTLGVSDPIFEAKQRIRLGRGTLQSGITNSSTTAQIQVSRYFSVLDDCEAIYSSRVRIDSEIIAVPELSGSSSSVQLLGSTASAPENLQRGNLGSTAASHSSGATIQELWTLGNISGPTYQAPMFLVLSLLLSSGGYYSSSDYDLIVESAYTDASTRSRRGRGAGMSPCDVAIAEMVALTFSGTIELFVEEDIDDLKDLIEREILRGSGCYFAAKPDGRLTVRSMAVPTVASLSFTDAFTRSDAATLGANWIAVSGVCDIVSNAASNVNAGTSTYQVYALTKGRASYYAQCVVSVARAAGVFVSTSTTAVTGYLFYQYNTTVYIYKAVAGTFTLLTSTATTAAPHTLRLDVSWDGVGNTLLGSVDGTAALRVASDTAVGQTKYAGITVTNDGIAGVVDDFTTDVDAVYDLTRDRVMGRTKWRISEGEIVNYLEIDYDYNPLTQDTSGTYIATDATSGTAYGIRQRSYSLPAITSTTDLATVTGWILQRFKNPSVTIEVECGLYESLLEIGDAVYLEDWSLPDLAGGVRGVRRLLCEVIARAFDPARGRTRLTLRDILRM